MLGRLDIAGFMDRYTFAVYNWFGMFVLSALAIYMMHKGKRSGKRERMVWGIVHGSFAAIWFIVLCVPWANVIAAQVYTRRANGLDPESDEAAELWHKADDCAVLADKQFAFLGSLLFTVSAISMVVIGVRALSRSRHGVNGVKATGVVNLIMSFEYAVFAVMCICKFISVYSMV
jgi:hypothetical protein